MAANFWASSHCLRWMLRDDKLADLRAKSRCVFLSAAELASLNDDLMRLVELVGRQLKWRQTVIATALVLYRRFFLLVQEDRYDPRLTAVTCMYLAAKIEELGQYSLSTLLKAVKEVVRREAFAIPEFTPQLVHDYEFFVLEALSFDLVIFHPYSDLVRYAEEARATPKQLQVAWEALNDAYASDAVLIFPPHVLALSALFLACVHCGAPDSAKQASSGSASLVAAAPAASAAARSTELADTADAPAAPLRWFETLNVRLGAMRKACLLLLETWRDRAANGAQRRALRGAVASKVKEQFWAKHQTQHAEHKRRLDQHKLEQAAAAAQQRKRQKLH